MDENNQVAIVAGEVLSDEVLEALIAESKADGFFSKIGHEAGVLDSPLKAGGKEYQLDTDAVIKRVLHISAANITRAVDKGIASDFAVVTFDEYPFPAFYQCGGRLTDLILSWASACGDSFETSVETHNDKKSLLFVGDRLLPKLNQSFSDHPHPFVVLDWKKGKSQDYVDIRLCGG